MRWLNIIYYVFFLLIILSCDKNNNFTPLISAEDDVKLGQQFSAEIEANPAQYPILDEVQYADAYNYLEGVWQEILNSGEIAYRQEFPWTIKIIQDDSTLNAFAIPGGYVYVYTGLIKYLDVEDDLAGVLGHEIAHGDLRHVSRNLQRQYGVSALLSIITGNQDPGLLSQIALTLAELQYSQAYESEADDKSVDYLANTKYGCASARSFFEKLIAEGQTGNTPAFLSTHPQPEDRVEDITAKAMEIQCDTMQLNPATYSDFKQMLP